MSGIVPVGSAVRSLQERVVRRLRENPAGLPYFAWALRGTQHTIEDHDKSPPVPAVQLARGQPLREHLEASDGSRLLLELLDGAFQGGNAFFDHELRLQLSPQLGGGGLVVLKLSCEPLLGTSGAVEGLQVYGLVTEASQVASWFETWETAARRKSPQAAWKFSTTHAVASPGPSRHKILVVDDCDETADLLEAALSSLKQNCISATSGGEALVAVQTFRPNICLLDLAMRGMDGYELAHRIRLVGGPDIAFVACSRYGDKAARETSRQAGFAAHLVKPVEMHTLGALLSFFSSKY